MFLAIRDISFAKGRFALMGGVVALITLLLVMLSGLTAGLGDQSTSSIAKLGSVHESGTSAPVDSIAFGAPGTSEPKASFTESEVTETQVDTWKGVDGVKNAEPLGISQTRLQSGSADTAGGTTNVAVFGVDPGGQLTPASVEDDTVVLSRTAAEDLSVTTGDRVTLGGTELRVASVVEDQWYSHTSVVWTALPTWTKIAHLSNPDQVGTVTAITYDDGAAVDEAAANSAADTVTTTRTGAFQALGAYQSEHGSLLMMQAFLYGISALVIVAFLTVWTVQRTRDIAVLKALGGSGKYILRDAITQAAIVLIAGAALGGAVGVAGGFFAAQAAPFLVDATTTLLPILGIVVLGLAGSALAVRRTTKVDALIALGGN
ncbi:ABC transporter permease [Arthrobacter sp. AOP36-A1-22]|uniref:ABC transporter permease n=1 Tax=unclassified Arthrobacter TaxID=235627 RepID=UPI0040341C07